MTAAPPRLLMADYNYRMDDAALAALLADTAHQAWVVSVEAETLRRQVARQKRHTHADEARTTALARATLRHKQDLEMACTELRQRGLWLRLRAWWSCR